MWGKGKRQLPASLLILALLVLTACTPILPTLAPKVTPEGKSGATAGKTVESTPTEAPTPTPYVTEEPDIRNIKWGATKEQVIAAEGKQPDENVGTVLTFYDVTAGGYPANVFYQFNDEDECYSVSYLLTTTHTNDNDYIDDYQSLKRKMSEKYGDPTIDEETWSQSLFKDNPEYYGLAVASGHLSYLTMYNTDKMSVTMFLNGDNYQINTLLMYVAKGIEAGEPVKDNSI